MAKKKIVEQMTSPLRRIERAKEHLDVLNDEIGAFVASQPYRCRVERDPENGRYVFYPYLSKPFPHSWGILIGEIVHGLRSALDNIAWSLAVKRDNITCFPIYIAEDAGFTTRLERLREDIRADIRAVQPYNRPEGERRRHALWVLSRVDNIDKHRLILPGLTKIYIATGLQHPKWFFMDGFTRLNQGDVEFTMLRPANLQKDFKPEIRGQITFNISQSPKAVDDPGRLLLRDLFLMHDFVRNDVYPRFAHFLEPEDGAS